MSNIKTKIISVFVTLLPVALITTGLAYRSKHVPLNQLPVAKDALPCRLLNPASSTRDYSCTTPLSVTVPSSTVWHITYPVQQAYHVVKPSSQTIKPSSVIDRIITIAKQEKYHDAAYLLALADCESSLDPSNKNTKGNTPRHSVDRGLFMFNSYWQRNVSNKCAFDLDCATRETIKRLKLGQYSLWACDRIIRRPADGRIALYSAYISTLSTSSATN